MKASKKNTTRRILEVCKQRPCVKRDNLKETLNCIEVTKSLYDSGIDYCVDYWTPEDSIGAATVTNLNVGDYLLVVKTEDGVGVCRVEREEFCKKYFVK